MALGYGIEITPTIDDLIIVSTSISLAEITGPPSDLMHMLEKLYVITKDKLNKDLT